MHPDWLQELAIRHVPQSIFVAIDAHELLSPAVPGRHLVIGDRPLAIVLRTEPQTVARPAERPSSDRLQPTVIRPVPNAGEVILFPQPERRVARPCARK